MDNSKAKGEAHVALSLSVSSELGVEISEHI
jgi:hypothetical protein